MNTSQHIAEKIEFLAKKRNISVNKLLTDCKLNKNALFTMKSQGHYPKIESLVKIASYLNCSVDYLLGLSPKGDDVAISDNPNNQGVIIGMNSTAPVTVRNGHERALTTQEKDLLRIYNTIDGREQTKLMRFAYDLERGVE